MGYGKRIDNEVEAAETLSKLVASTNNGVFFGGAGVSTASGIPDFRSVDGLYHQHFAYPPETMLSHAFYEKRIQKSFLISIERV